MEDIKKKELPEGIETMPQQEEDSSSFDIRTIFTILVLNWQWFLLSLIIFVCGALIYLRYTEPVYKVSARMLIKDEQRKRGASQMLANVEDLGFLSNSTGIENEMEVLRSRILLRDVVKDLKVYTEYRTKGKITNPVIYQSQPVNIDLDPQHLDSLDFNLLEKTEWLNMKLWKEDGYYMLSGSVMRGQSELSAFTRRAKELPASFTTELGTVTMTANPGKVWKDGSIYLITLRPPMQ